MRVIDEATVERHLDLGALVDAVAVAMADLSSGRASVPPRIAAHVGSTGLLAAMPAYSPGLGILAAKLLTVYPGNVAAGRPAHQAMIMTFDATTGRPTSIMGGDAITALRTAACSALSIRLLARPDAEVLALLGTGPQAHAHARLAALVRPFREIRVAGRDRGRAEAFASALGELGPPIRPCDFDTAVDGADVVCAATSTVEPIVRAERVAPGTHVASVGYVPHGRELDAGLYAHALVAVEHRDTTLQPFPAGSNDLVDAVAAGLLAPADVVEIGELVAGTRAGRTDDRQLTVYKSVGVAIQDAAAAAVVLAALDRT